MADTFTDAIEAGASGGPRFSQEGLDLVRTFEGFRPKAYYDLGGNRGTLTVGYGFTKSDIPDLTPSYTIDRRRAEQMLPSLLDKKYGPSVTRNVKVPLNDQQYSALTSFVYNVGPGAFERSTLLKKLNAGDFSGAASEFDKWIFAGGKPVEGLARRRAAEKALFSNDTQALGAILERQKFGSAVASGNMPGSRQGTGDDFRSAIEEAVYRDNGVRATKQQAEQKMPAGSTTKPISRAEAEQPMSSGDKLAEMERRLKRETAGLAEPPRVDGEPSQTQVASATPTDPFSELPPPVPEDQRPKSGTSTVNALLKLAGKEPIDLSGAGSGVEVDFEFGLGDILSGLGKTLSRNLTDYFAKGGAISPVPDSPEEMEQSEIPFAESVNFSTSMPNVQSGLARTAGLAPGRRS